MPRDDFCSPDSVDPVVCWKIISECTTLWISPPNTWMECNNLFLRASTMWSDGWIKTLFLITEVLKTRNLASHLTVLPSNSSCHNHRESQVMPLLLLQGEGLHQTFTSYADERGCKQKHYRSIFATKILCFVGFIYTITLLSSRVEKKRSIYKMMKFIYVHDVTLVNIKLLKIYLGRKSIVLWGYKLNSLKYIIYKYIWIYYNKYTHHIDIYVNIICNVLYIYMKFLLYIHYFELYIN